MPNPQTVDLSVWQRRGRIAATALVVCVGYYVGANLGFILKFPASTPSVMWPPNAILTATLLLAPVKRWWIYLLAVLPAHLIVELQAAFPPSLVLALFVTNCSEALIAAVLVRQLSDAPARFDSLRRVASFIAAGALFAPFVTSFADATAVTLVRGEPYWLVWRARFLSNVLSEVTVVPVLVMMITAGPEWIRRASPRRRLEGAFLGLTLVSVGIAVLADPPGLDVPGSTHTALAFLLPLILWGAVRFGPAGASLSLLATALIAVSAGTHGRGPFASLPLAESIMALQIFLSVVAIPFMCLAAVIEERRRTEEALAEGLRFEELRARLSGAFVHIPSTGVDEALAMWLQRLGEFLGLDRLMLLQPSGNNTELVVRCSWAAPGCEGGPQMIPTRDLPWITERLLRGELFAFSQLDELPADAGRDKDWLRRQGVASNLTIPLVGADRILGGLAFMTTAAPRLWPDDLLRRLRLVAAVFANALARKEMEDALRASELMKSAILASLSGTVVVLDRDGRVIAVNKRQERLAGALGVASDAIISAGSNYLEVCRNAVREGASHATEAIAGIEAVLDGSSVRFNLEYRSPNYSGAGERWILMSVVPLDWPQGGAVVSHADIGDQRRAEMELQRSRQELAHFTRVSTVGELAASLAHELSQPLAGIMTNVQAARRFLRAELPDIGELQSILSDIVDDNRRAGDLIHRLRDLLRKADPQKVLLDLNALISDVTKLLGSDAVIRNITVTLDLEPRPIVVRADRVQLQQVILNLLLNAMDAITECAVEDRKIVVQTRAGDVETVHVSVEDAGPGLQSGTEDLVFEPFYTTKPDGMGMGLSIARSIIEEHGGLIWAINNTTRGATFHFALPLAGRGSA